MPKKGAEARKAQTEKTRLARLANRQQLSSDMDPPSAVLNDEDPIRDIGYTQFINEDPDKPEPAVSSPKKLGTPNPDERPIDSGLPNEETMERENNPPKVPEQTIGTVGEPQSMSSLTPVTRSAPSDSTVFAPPPPPSPPSRESPAAAATPAPSSGRKNESQPLKKSSGRAVPTQGSLRRSSCMTCLRSALNGKSDGKCYNCDKRS